MKKLRKFSLTLGLFLICGCANYPPIPAGSAMVNREAKIMNYLETLVAQDKFPGIQYLVVDKDKVLFSYAGGWAVKGAAPMTMESPMMYYSATKILTAAAMLRLVGQGKLNLDDRLERTLPDTPYRGVTLRQVLSHTAGIPNPMLGNMYVHRDDQHASFDRKRLLAEALNKNGKLQSQPGQQFAYSNLGFALLGEVIEITSGLEYEAYLQQEIFQPLGIAPHEMNFTFEAFATGSKGYVERFSLMNLAMGFMLKEFTPEKAGRWKTFKEHWYFNFPAHGGVIGTASGWAKFLQDQLRADTTLFPAREKEQFYQLQHPAATGRHSTDVALAWFYNGRGAAPYYFHEGGAFGYVTEVRLYPRQGIASVLLVNTTTMPHKPLMDEVDGLFLR